MYIMYINIFFKSKKESFEIFHLKLNIHFITNLYLLLSKMFSNISLVD